MTNSSEETAGFNRPRPATDPFIARQYEDLGLGTSPSLEDIEPVALNLMRDKKILEGMGLVLGRRIDARDTQEDPELGQIGMLAMRDPEQAFSGLLLKLTLEELTSEG